MTTWDIGRTWATTTAEKIPQEANLLADRHMELYRVTRIVCTAINSSHSVESIATMAASETPRTNTNIAGTMI